MAPGGYRGRRGEHRLVHGTTQSASGYGSLITALEERDHRCVAVRVPDGLATARDRSASMNAVTAAILGLPTQLSHDRTEGL